MERIIDALEFFDAVSLVDRIQELVDQIPDPEMKTVVYIEGGAQGQLSRASLIEKTLSDLSKVYNVRLS